MRLFIALELEQLLKDELLGVQGRLKHFADDLKFTSASQFHLTLNFLGETDASLLEQIQARMKQAASRCSPFEISISGCGCFPPGRAPRVLWAGIAEPTGTLLKLQQELETSLRELGFKTEERAYSPHLTLARVREGRSPHALREATEKLRPVPLSQKVETVHLVQSILKPTGAEYSTVFHSVLGSGSDALPAP